MVFRLDKVSNARRVWEGRVNFFEIPVKDTAENFPTIGATRYAPLIVDYARGLHPPILLRTLDARPSDATFPLRDRTRGNAI